MSERMKKIAIIGAGIAGLACARVLVSQGFDVRVFDKGRGPGGRMSTRRVTTELGEVSFDHGAQYFTARDPDFVAEVARLAGLGAVDRWTGCLVKLHKDGSNSPLAHEDIFVGTPGMNAVVRALGDGVTIAWATRVQTITRAGGSWQLTAQTGEVLGAFDHIVCGVPAEQVAPLLTTIAPDFADQAKAISSLPCWAGMFVFDRPISIPFDAMRVEGYPIVDFIAMNHSKPGRADVPSYVVHAHADWSQTHLEETPERVAQHLEKALRGYADNTPNLVFSTAHRWRYARVEVAHGVGHLWDSAQGIGACGDWLSGPRVESAWLSGHHLGHAIAQSQ
jgi:renalase